MADYTEKDLKAAFMCGVKYAQGHMEGDPEPEVGSWIDCLFLEGFDNEILFARPGYKGPSREVTDKRFALLKLPRRGDKLTPNGWKFVYVDEHSQLAHFDGKHLPIPLENIGATDKPGLWKLIKLNSTDEEKAAKAGK